MRYHFAIRAVRSFRNDPAVSFVRSTRRALDRRRLTCTFFHLIGHKIYLRWKYSQRYRPYHMLVRKQYYAIQYPKL